MKIRHIYASAIALAFFAALPASASSVSINFDNVAPVWTQFSTDPNRSTGYSKNPISGMKNGDVIAIDFGSSVYGLIYLRAVDNGTTNTSLQSAIEFRALFPIIAP